MKKNLLYQKIVDLKRIDAKDARYLWKHFSWQEITELGWKVRCKKHNPDRVSYTMFNLVNYTNYCKIGCSFCSFKNETGNGKGYTLSIKEVFAKIDIGLKAGADQLLLQGGVNTGLTADYYLDLLHSIKSEYGIHIRGFSPVEIIQIQEKLGMSLKHTLIALKEAGLDSVPGAGAEILNRRMRAKLSPKKISPGMWKKVMLTCHELGLYGSANIVFGSDETFSDILSHLILLRDIQDKFCGFKSFVAWTFQKRTKDFFIRTVRPDEYLKLLAFCRIFLDNIPNIETSLLVIGKEIGSLALRAGANDINSVVIEENVLESFGISSEKEALEFIKNAGFKPFRRDFNLVEVPIGKSVKN
ncbi:radical SAM protein [Candidatus Riflebacteria bacterium]